MFSFPAFLELIDKFIEECFSQIFSLKELPAKMDFNFLIHSTYLLQLRLVQINETFSYIVTLRRAADILTFKYEASKCEYMSLLINSLSHEMITPLTEILSQVHMGDSKSTQFDSQYDINPMSSPHSKRRFLKAQELGGTNSISGSTGDDKGSKGSTSNFKDIRSAMTTLASTEKSTLSNSISQIASRLTLFVQTLLTYSQILNNKFELDAEKETNVRALLYEISSYYAEKCVQKTITVEINCADTLTIKVDKKRLICVLQALLDNAIKFTTQPKKSIVLQAEVSQSNFSVVIKVIDMGIGINTKDLDILCRILKKPFSTETTSSSAGLGIGLRTAQAIISQLSNNTGEMQIVTKLGLGTTVSFEIPYKKKIGEQMSFKDSGEDIAEIDLFCQSAVPIYEKERNFKLEVAHEERIEPNLTNLSEMMRKGEADMMLIGAIAQSIRNISSHRVSRLRVAQVCRTQPPSYFNANKTQKRRASKKEKTLLSIISDPASTPKVLIVDDEVFLLEYLREMLEEWGIDVYTANSPDSAIQLARMFVQIRIHINLVFMDYNMPEMNGPQCVKVLKSPSLTSAFRMTKFVALTAQNDKIVKDSFREAGVSTFIFKPYTYMQIKELLIENSLLPESQI
jgi:signal transduction histidine kinase